MIGFSSLWISLLGLPMFANISSDRFEFQEQDDPQEILIEMRGVLRCRFEQDNERLKSARVYSDQGMLDLELNSVIERFPNTPTKRLNAPLRSGIVTDKIASRCSPTSARSVT